MLCSALLCYAVLCSPTPCYTPPLGLGCFRFEGAPAGVLASSSSPVILGKTGQGTCFQYTARFYFGANMVIQVLFYRLSFLIRQIIRKECN